MKLIVKHLFTVLVFTNASLCFSQINYLKTASKILSSKSENEVLHVNYTEQEHVLGHNSKPWKTNVYKIKGEVWINKRHFSKRDSLTTNRNRNYTSKTDIVNFNILNLDYGDQEIRSVSSKFVFEKLMNTARYSPLTLIEYVIKNNSAIEIKSTDDTICYSTKINEFLTKIYINRANNLVEKITYTSFDELYGDVTTTFLYSEYRELEQVSFPRKITVEKINGKIIDHIEITDSSITSNLPKLLSKPIGYQIVEDEIIPELKTTKYNDFIYFIDLLHTDDKVMVVEFDDYVLVAEAPINSKNGELIISEVKKIIPTKPIKYFVFGHHHPHYLGGLRAFVHEGATILCTSISKEYVEFIANSSHTIEPDNLELEPKPLKTQIITDHLILGSKRKMEIYFIGEKSAHTIDYLIYYFPEEQLLFQDDLCWIPKNGDITKASARQLGLYNSIKTLNLKVKTIIQSWPIESHKVKTVFPFTDLEKSVLIN